MIAVTPPYYYHHTCQPFCSLRCSEWANTKHLFTLFLSGDQRRFWLQTSSADDLRCQMFPQHQMASPAIHIAFLAGPPKHHHKYFPRGSSLPIHSRETSPGQDAPHEVKWFWRIPIITSEFCATAIQETRWKNGHGWEGQGKRTGEKKNRIWWKESRRRYKWWHKGGAAVGFLIRIIQVEMAPGLGEISAAFSRITPGTIWTQSCLMSPTHPSCM